MCTNSCGHAFAWYSVLPPSHCAVCGACLCCGARLTPRPSPTPYYPRPWWQQGPHYTTTTVHTSNVTSGGTPMNLVAT